MARSDHYHVRHSQNFLTNSRLVRQLVGKTRIDRNDTVLEIGPGKGIITRALAERAGHVITIEQDEKIARRLGQPGVMPDNVTIILGDAIEAQLPVTPFSVFANIPFRHTAAIVGKLTTGMAPPTESWLVVQREAAQRYIPDSSNTMQAIMLAPIFNVAIEHHFSRNDFSPPPKVESVLLRIASRDRPMVPQEDIERYRSLVDVLFSAWQPNIRDAVKSRLPRLASQHVLRSVSLDWRARVSSLQLEHWIGLFECLVELDDDRVWHELNQQCKTNEKQRLQLDRPSRTNVRRNSRS